MPRTSNSCALPGLWLRRSSYRGSMAGTRIDQYAGRVPASPARVCGASSAGSSRRVAV